MHLKKVILSIGELSLKGFDNKNQRRNFLKRREWTLMLKD